MTEQLKQFHPTLYQIHDFILKAKELGYGEIILTIKTHDYVSKTIDMDAIKPNKKTIATRIRKRILVPKGVDL